MTGFLCLSNKDDNNSACMFFVSHVQVNAVIRVCACVLLVSSFLNSPVLLHSVMVSPFVCLSFCVYVCRYVAQSSLSLSLSLYVCVCVFVSDLDFNTSTQTHTHTYIHIQVQKRRLAHMRSWTHTHTHTQIDTHTHTHTHTWTHTHT